MNESTPILALPLFWREERILQFWENLCECLKQKIANQNKNLAKLEIIGENTRVIKKNSWFDEFDEPIEEYLELMIKHSTIYISPYLGTKLFDLLRAFRDLNVHRYGSAISVTTQTKDAEDEKKKLADLKSKLLSRHKKEGIQFWLGKFPDFLLVTYSVGYDVCLNSMKDIGTEFRDTFFADFESWELPETLKEFTKEFDDWITAETTTKKTGKWKYSFKTDDDFEITFLNIPKNIPFHSIVDLESRELLTLNSSVATSSLRISRNSISAEDEAAFLLNPDKGTLLAQNFHKSAGKTKITNLKVENPTEFPFCAFSEVLSAALAVCLEHLQNVSGNKNKCVIFTEGSFTNIRSTVEQFCHARKMKPPINEHEITWSELRPEYQVILSDCWFPLHKNSEVNEESIQLKQIIENNNSITSTFKGDALLKLMHARSSGLFESNVEIRNSMNLQKTVLSNVDTKTLYNDDQFVNLVSNQSKNVYLISGIAGVGKSTFLSKMGQLVNHDKHLVLQASCKHIKRDSKALNGWSWLNNKFEEVVFSQYVLKQIGYKMLLLFDEFELLKDKEKHDFVVFLEHIFTHYENLITNIFLAARENSSFEKIFKSTSLTKQQVATSCFKIHKLNPLDKVDFITSYCWKQYERKPKDKERLRTVAEKIIKSIGSFRYVADTPAACRFISKIYEHVARTDSELSFLSDVELHEKFQNLNLETSFPKNIHKPSFPEKYQINMATVDLDSTVFKLFKRSIVGVYLWESLNLRFQKCFGDKIFFCMVTPEEITVYGNFIDLTYWKTTTFPDYYCALFISKNEHLQYFKDDVRATNDFLSWLFHFSNGYFMHKEILQFLDSMLNHQHALSPFCATTPENVSRILYNLLCSGYNHIFIAVTSSVNFDVLKPHPTKPTVKWHKADDLMSTVIKYNLFKTLQVMVEIFDFDVTSTNEEAKTILHYVLRMDPVNVLLFQYLVSYGADISTKNYKNQSVLKAACYLKDSSEKDQIIFFMVENGNTQFLKNELDAIKASDDSLSDLITTLNQKLESRRYNVSKQENVTD